MGHNKWKYVFKHVQNEKIQIIILRMRKRIIQTFALHSYIL